MNNEAGGGSEAAPARVPFLGQILEFRNGPRGGGLLPSCSLPGYCAGDENIRRSGFVAGLLTRHDLIALAAAISSYLAARDKVRASRGDFVEVYVNTPLEVCEARDPKGLYRKARAGELPTFTGIDDPYEPPLRAEVECRTDRESLEESIAKVLAAIDRVLEE